MNQNKLKLNDDKTEALLIHTKQSFNRVSTPVSLRVGDAHVQFSSSARDLGFIITENMALDAHVSNVCRSAYYAIRQISSIRPYLTIEATKTLVSAFVLSRLDYCNSLLGNCPKFLIDKLQRVQNSAARLVFRVGKRRHITPLLRALHWLPVQARIQ